jgi:hypothetical protein
MSKLETIKIQDGETTIELTGADKETFLAQQAKDQAEQAILETEYAAKQKAKQNILKKLGLTQDELKTLLGA